MSARESGIFLFCLMCCCLHPSVCCDIFHLTSQITPDNTTPSLDSGLATELLWGLFKTRNHDRPPLNLTAGGDNSLETSYYCPDGDSRMVGWNHQRSAIVMFINIKFWYGVEPTRKWWSCNLSWYNCDDNQTVYWYWVNFYLPGYPHYPPPPSMQSIIFTLLIDDVFPSLLWLLFLSWCLLTPPPHLAILLCYIL